MHELTPCPDCCELLLPSMGDCPWCGRAAASRRTPTPEHVALLGLGLIFGSGGCARELYGIVCMDSGHCGPGTDCPPYVLQLTGTVASVTGSPLGLDATAVGGSVTAQLGFLECQQDEDPAETVGRYTGGAGPVSVALAGLRIGGTGQQVTVVTDGTPDSFELTDGPSGGLSMTVDDEDAADLQLSIRFVDPSGAALEGAWLPMPFRMTAEMAETFSLSDANGTVEIQVTGLSDT